MKTLRAISSSLFLLIFLGVSSLATKETEAYLPSSGSNNDNNENNNNNQQTIMRAWTCHGRNQRDMVDRLRQANIVRNDAVQRVLNEVDRQYYVPPGAPAYQDSPLSIGLGQTISAPHMHAHVLEEMYPYVAMKKKSSSDTTTATTKEEEQEESNNANNTADDEQEVSMLDVGCGSGYLTACMGRWLQPKDGDGSILGRTGRVHGIDVHRDLVERTRQNMERAGDGDLLASGTVTLTAANGWNGLPEAAPFDAIHVGAAAHAFPAVLAQQLKVGGVLIVPIGPQMGTQALYKVERIKDSSASSSSKKKDASFDASDYRLTELLGVRYVPLVDRPPS